MSDAQVLALIRPRAVRELNVVDGASGQRGPAILSCVETIECVFDSDTLREDALVGNALRSPPYFIVTETTSADGRSFVNEMMIAL